MALRREEGGVVGVGGTTLRDEKGACVLNFGRLLQRFQFLPKNPTSDDF